MWKPTFSKKNITDFSSFILEKVSFFSVIYILMGEDARRVFLNRVSTKLYGWLDLGKLITGVRFHRQSDHYLVGG